MIETIVQLSVTRSIDNCLINYLIIYKGGNINIVMAIFKKN